MDLYHSVDEKIAQVYDSIILIFLLGPKDKFWELLLRDLGLSAFNKIIDSMGLLGLEDFVADLFHVVLEELGSDLGMELLSF